MKKKILLCILLFSCTVIFKAQGQPVIQFQTVTGGSSYDALTSLDLSYNGGWIVGGISISPTSGDKTDWSSTEDFWLVKYKANGHIRKDITIGGGYHDYCSVIRQTADGGFITGGNIAVGWKNTAPVDYWVFKHDKFGNLQWSKHIIANNRDNLVDIRQTTDKGYILGGTSMSSKSGDKSEDGRGFGDFWIVKLDSAGNIEWDKTIGGSDDENFASIRQTADGGYILGGSSFSDISGEKTQNKRGGTDYWIVKTDAHGNVQWDKTIGGNASEELSALQQTSDGGYIIGGTSASDISGEKSENKRDTSTTELYNIGDYWIVKLDAAGNIQWDKTIGGKGYDVFASLEQTIDGGYILGGTSRSGISGEKTESQRDTITSGLYDTGDYWIVKLNAAGNIQWDKTIGGNTQDNLIAVRELRKDHYLLAGDSRSSLSGDKSQPSKGDVDYWIVGIVDKKQTLETNIAEAINSKPILNLTNKALKVYPNPAKDVLHIQSTGKCTIALSDQAGKILVTKTINGNTDINISHLSPGLYYLKNISNGEVQKVIITK